MGDKSFVLAGLLVGFIFGLMHGMTTPKKLLLCSLWGGIVGIGVLLFVLFWGYVVTPLPAK